MAAKGKILIAIVVVLLISSIGATAAQDDAGISIIFMHHSTGDGVIRDGNLRQLFSDLGYAFWDHGYNGDGLRDPAGESLGINWDVPGDNTDPDGWYEIFNQPYTDPPTNTFSHMLQHDVIIFKSCFPSSDIADEDMFETYRSYYLSIRDVMDQHPDKLFVAWTTPPLVPNATTPENAARAQRWAAYLTSNEYRAGHPNVVVFDIFSLWSDENGFLKAEYRQDEWDSHPNALANQTVAPLLVALVDQAVHEFIAGAPSVLPETAAAADEQPDVLEIPAEQPETESALAINPGDVIEDFENGEQVFSQCWWFYSDTPPEPTLALVTPGYNSPSALAMTFDLDADVYAGFGADFYPTQDWSAASGLVFFWSADQPDLDITVFVWVENPDDSHDPTPFVTIQQPPVGVWSAVGLPWELFVKPDWYGDAGTDTFDPAHIVRVSFDVGSWEHAQSGTLKIDDLQLASADAAPCCRR